MESIALPKHHPVTGEKLYTIEEFKEACKGDIDEISKDLYIKLQKKKSQRAHTYA